MSELRTFIVEDEEGPAALLTEWVREHSSLQLCGLARDGLSALDFLHAHPVDLLLLDVDLPELSGVVLLGRLERQPYTIFTTAYAQHAVTAFDLGAVDFLQKPFGPARFAQAIQRCLERDRKRDQELSFGVAAVNRPGLVISQRAVHHMVDFAEIVYLSTHDHRTVVHTMSEEILWSGPLSELERQLPPANFMRVHRQYLVRLERVRRLEGQPGGRANLFLRDPQDTCLPVGRSFLPALTQRLGLTGEFRRVSPKPES